jgi:hypothetical protein
MATGRVGLCGYVGWRSLVGKTRSPPLSGAPRIQQKPTSVLGANGRESCGTRQSTNRIPSLWPNLFAGRVASTLVPFGSLGGWGVVRPRLRSTGQSTCWALEVAPNCLTPLNTSPASSPVNASRLPSRVSRASLRASAVRYSFTMTNFHRLPFACRPAHPSTTSIPDSRRNQEAGCAAVHVTADFKSRKRFRKQALLAASRNELYPSIDQPFVQ